MRWRIRETLVVLLVLAVALSLPRSGQATGWVTTILTVNPVVVTYGDRVTVQATLVDADTGAGVPGKLVSFLVNGRFRQAVTDSSGVATLPAFNMGRLAAGAYPGGISARFDGFYGTTVFEASTGAGDLLVARRPLRVIPEAVAREYGDENPPTLPYRLDGFAFADDERVLTAPPACQTTATRTSGAGIYDITCAGLAADNYEGDYSTPGLLTVTPAPMTIVPDDQVKPYGEQGVSFTVRYLGAWKLGEGPDVLSGAPECASPGANRWAGAGAYPIHCKGQWSANYALKYAEGRLRVTPPPAPAFRPH